MEGPQHCYLNADMQEQTHNLKKKEESHLENLTNAADYV